MAATRRPSANLRPSDRNTAPALSRTPDSARRSADRSLRHRAEVLEQWVDERTNWLALLHDVTRASNDVSSWTAALRAILLSVCRRMGWQIGHLYLPDPEQPGAVVALVGCRSHAQFEDFHQLSLGRRHGSGNSLPWRVYSSGTPVWATRQADLLALLPVRAAVAQSAGLISGAALPVTVRGRVIGVLELFSDRVQTSTPELSDLMQDVSAAIGRVLDRERLTVRMADLAWREQQDLVHTLHDSLGQTLTGLGMLSTALTEQLEADRANARILARQIAEQAQEALSQVRQLSRGLFPLAVDPSNLLRALRDLAATTQALRGIRVRVQERVTRQVADIRAATQWYRIAQEAVTNAVKHARATRIVIDVVIDDSRTQLRVADNGIGISRAAAEGEGLGLQIMRHRAATIGALLSIHSGRRGGTVVSCATERVSADR
jgi:signal transduction histidine kinase